MSVDALSHLVSCMCYFLMYPALGNLAYGTLTCFTGFFYATIFNNVVVVIFILS